MEYWNGIMDWAIEADWKCETCGHGTTTALGKFVIGSGLEWGLIHAQCRCSKCHTQYRMRNQNGDVVTKPICQLKPEYKEPAKLAWQKYHIPIDDLNDAQWDEFVGCVGLPL